MEQQLSLILLHSPRSVNNEEPLLARVPPTKHHYNRTFFKFFLYFVLIGLSYYFIISSFFVPPPLSLISLDSPSGNVSSKNCDLFVGDWVPDPTGPRYTNLSCNHIQDFQNCLFNGRPDENYLFWRWKPRNCDLPKFEPSQFLDSLRNKWLAFIGDSIARNHVQSLICILSQVEKVEEIYHDKEHRSKIWRFPAYNFTLSVVWAPFLIKSDTSSSSGIQLYLDQLDHKWTDQYSNFDYVVISGGKWFLKSTIFHENDKITGCHYCQGRYTDLGYTYSYRKAINQFHNFIQNSPHKPLVLFRTTTPDHFENGEWNTGGYCNRTMPFKQGEGKMKTEDELMHDIELEMLRKHGSGSNIRLLDTTAMSFLRPDGHPGPYRNPHPFVGVKDKKKVQRDCLHWCLPGPIDSWNDVMIETILNRNGKAEI
ncbi:hypothetical protein AALP_AA6G014500 [Arabis alpina]|uniref:Uncharacterized protein n=1 Tax=Arabis alpina TaxID=50452 RepID=A0A087GLD2_ARAAL|nr:hypothetical protein AALP_AA6G014500 [Arabis alpina]